MRIRGKSSASSVSFSSPCSSPAPSSSPPSSSSSSITINSSVSSQDSSNSCPFSSTLIPTSRCHGLDLLVKAIHQVTAGSVVGYPYIQRRVMIRRRRRELKLDGFTICELLKEEREQNEKKKMSKKGKSVMKRNKGMMGLPSKYHDSLLQPWKPKSRRNRSAIGDEIETGL
ncbi:Hypothetical predicted protein [Olea europaea subsp. europaea]|uniref:Uncharacterized protein n=1 Tax=Olea europaea subsp. europaea TaxID=158383 RepID=A0A8S0V4I9_OLEEU|nr:Hypothetical predicted protein [Olea europaea subsp. europaea]